MPPKEPKTAFNIRPMIAQYLIFGYTPTIPFPTINYLSKLYSIAMWFVVVYFNMWNPLNYSGFIEYFSYVTVVMFAKELHLKKFFRYIPIVDGYASKSVHSKYVMLHYLCVVVIAANRILQLFLIIQLDGAYPFPSYMYTLLWMAVDTGRMSIAMVFVLLYCRIRVIKEMISNSIDRTPQNRFESVKLIGMFEAVKNGYEKVNFIITFLMTVLFATYFMPQIFHYTFTHIDAIKSSGLDTSHVMWIFGMIIQIFIHVLMPAAFLDKTNEQINNIKVACLWKRFNSKDERERAEIYHLVTLLRPLQCKIGWLTPLNVRMVLSFLSYYVTTTIAVLQLKDIILLKTNRRGPN